MVAPDFPGPREGLVPCLDRRGAVFKILGSYNNAGPDLDLRRHTTDEFPQSLCT